MGTITVPESDIVGAASASATSPSATPAASAPAASAPTSSGTVTVPESDIVGPADSTSTTPPVTPPAAAGMAGGFMKPQVSLGVGTANLLAAGAEKIFHMPKGSLQATETNESPLTVGGQVGNIAGETAQWMAGEGAVSGALSKGAKFLGETSQLISEITEASKYIKSATGWGEFLAEHPQAAWLLNSIRRIGGGAVTGAVTGAGLGAGQGAATGQAAEQAKTGAEFGAAGGVISEVAGVAKDVAQGPARAQAAAQKALIQNPWRNATTSLRTTLEKPITNVMADAKANFHAIDDAAGTDIKAAYDRLEVAEDKIRETAPGSPEEAIWEKAKTTALDTIADAQKAVTDKLGPVKGGTILQKADALYKRASALKDVEAKVFKNPSIVEGNNAAGTKETVNVDSAVKALQKLQDNTKYGASRLEQAFGKQGAKGLLSDMYDAQRQGIQAMARSQMAKTVGKWLEYGAALAGGSALATEAIHHLVP